MAFEKVKQYFEENGLGDRVLSFEADTGTVEEAALAVGCEPKQIAKTMSFLLSGDEPEPILILTAGDARVDNHKYKEEFHEKAKMIPWDEVEGYIGHAPGGVCPFAINENVTVYLDESLRRFDIVYPAAGNDHSAVRLSLAELEKYSGYEAWIDVCKGWKDEQ